MIVFNFKLIDFNCAGHILNAVFVEGKYIIRCIYQCNLIIMLRNIRFHRS